MGAQSKIEWTDATWNPVLGCRRVSPGCQNCYAERMAPRLAGPGKRYEGLVRSTPDGPRWTGARRTAEDLLDQPLRWRKPRRVFVCSMSDLFFEEHPDEEIAAVFGVMAAADRHVFQVLTKRPRRMREWFKWLYNRCASEDGVAPWHVLGHHARRQGVGLPQGPITDLLNGGAWPLPNVWIGVSAEDQQRADERIPELLETPAAVRFVSYEPALGPIDFNAVPRLGTPVNGFGRARGAFAEWQEEPMRAKLCNGIDWVIAGAESGPGARPYELDWFRSVRDQCEAAGVAFFLKQTRNERGRKVSLPLLDGRRHAEAP